MAAGDMALERKASAEPEAPAPGAESEYDGELTGLARAKFGSYSDYRQLNQVDPKSVVQTGAGLPNWSWNQWSLRWSGPVHKDHEMRLWLLSPPVNRGLTFVRSALLILLAMLLFRGRETSWRKREDDDDEGGGKTSKRAKFWKPLFHVSLVLLTLAAVFPTRSVAVAQTLPAAGGTARTGPVLLGEVQQGAAAVERWVGAAVVVTRTVLALEDAAIKLTAEVRTVWDAIGLLASPADVLESESLQQMGGP